MTLSYHYLAATSVLVGTLVASHLSEHRVPEKLAVPLAQISDQIGDWHATGDYTLPARTAFVLRATSYLSRGYKRGNQNLDLFIAYYEEQRAGENMHSPKHCLPGAGWEIWQLGSARVPIDGKPLEINKYSIENAGTRELMFYWYQSKDRVIASEYLGKILLARDTLVTGRTAGSIVRLILPDTPTATNEGIRFAADVIPEVWRCLGRNP